DGHIDAGRYARTIHTDALYDEFEVTNRPVVAALAVHGQRPYSRLPVHVCAKPPGSFAVPACRGHVARPVDALLWVCKPNVDVLKSGETCALESMSVTASTAIGSNSHVDAGRYP